MGAYFIVEAPGHYGDRSKVLSCHNTASEAKRSMGRNKRLCVRKGCMLPGDLWLRAYEQFYPIVTESPPASTPAGGPAD
jgi:hypothetical protein